MCSIYGIWSEEFSGDLSAIATTLAHRGPDDVGEFHDHPLHLGHRRLAILDLSQQGHQPMHSRDQRFVLVFNGEIYNYQTLREELQNEGYTFDSQTDTEVLLSGYIAWGENVLKRLYGMFAFAIWDRDQQELFLARDATGVKPLLYIQLSDNEFAFTSEAKAFLELPTVKLELDQEAISQYLQMGYVWYNNQGIFQGVQKLPPGSFIRVRNGQADLPQQWWSPPKPNLQAPYNADELDRRADELYEILQEVVQQQLVADVPIGLLLSGGLDSSILAAITTRCLDQPLKTVTIGFEPCQSDERPYARQVANYIGSDHTEVLLHPQDVIDEFTKSAWFYDDLFRDTAFITSLAAYRVCQQQGLKVVLVGEGADEIFGGYTHLASLTKPYLDILPSALHQYLFFRYYSGMDYLPPGLSKFLYFFLPYYSGFRDKKQRQQFMELIEQLQHKNDKDWFTTARHYETVYQLPNYLNMKVDRASMANSIEARVPYQDQRVVEFALRTPRAFLLGSKRKKLLLRHLAKRHHLLPEAIIERRKLGMPIPGEWITQDPTFFSFAAETILAPDSWAWKLGMGQKIKTFFENEQKSRFQIFRRPLFSLAWKLLVLQTWSKAYGFTK